MIIGSCGRDAYRNQQIHTHAHTHTHTHTHTHPHTHAHACTHTHPHTHAHAHTHTHTHTQTCTQTKKHTCSYLVTYPAMASSIRVSYQAGAAASSVCHMCILISTSAIYVGDYCEVHCLSINATTKLVR